MAIMLFRMKKFIMHTTVSILDKRHCLIDIHQKTNQNDEP